MPAKTIKLFVDGHSLEAGFQGTQTFIRELYNQLLMNYPDLDIYWGVHDEKGFRTLFPSVVPDHILLYKKQPASILRFVFDIPAFIRQYHFDAAHFQYITPLPQAGCCYIVTTHDVLFNDFSSSFSFTYRTIRDILFGLSIKHAAIKTTVSVYSQQRIAYHYNISETSISVIPNGVIEPSIIKERAEQVILAKYGIKNFILYVGRIEPRKNHVLLLEKYLKLELYKKGIPLVFIGLESLTVDRLQQAIQKLNDEQRAMFYWFPQVEQADLVAFYSACRIFVYPSKAEGFGIPPLEAAVCEVPVLCSSATAMAEFDMLKPWMFNPDNEEEFESKLAAIVEHPPSPAYLKKVAQTILKQYQWQQSAQLFYGALKAGLNKKILSSALATPAAYHLTLK